MNIADLVILLVCALSITVSILRGFIREVFSIAVWVVAAVVALHMAEPLSVRLEPWVELPSARVIAAFVGVFVVILVIGALLNYLLGKLIKGTGLSGTDRMLGALFGAARGIVLVVMAVLVASITPFPDDPWWRESRLLPEFERLAEWAVEQAPESLKSYLGAEPQTELQD